MRLKTKSIIKWHELPLRALDIRTILDNCETVSELAETSLVFISEMEESDDTQWAEMLRQIFCPVYLAITGMEYESEKFKTC